MEEEKSTTRWGEKTGGKKKTGSGEKGGQRGPTTGLVATCERKREKRERRERRERRPNNILTYSPPAYCW
jgi:hypothetical protein